MKRQEGLLVVGLLLGLVIIFFRPYFFKNQVPFPANLLVSFYSPWKFNSLPEYPQGVPNKPIGYDNLRNFYPYRKFTTEQLTAGKLPLWNPFVFSGNVHLATFQTAVFYPLNLVYQLLPLIDAWSFLVLIQPILTSWFTYLFLRVLKLTVRASLFGSITFAFSGWMIAWWEEGIVIEHSVLWLPLALLAVAKFKETNKPKYWLILIIALVLSFLAGFLQTTLYVFVTVFLWSIYLFFRTRFETNARGTAAIFLSWVLLAFLLVSLITAVAWLPAAEIYLVSPRLISDAVYLFKNYLMSWQHLFTFIAPDFWGNPGAYNYFGGAAFYHEKVLYLGILPLLFTLFGLFAVKRSGLSFWKIFSLVTLSLGFQLPTSWLWYYLRIPILASAQPSRIFVLTTFGLSVLSAFGLEEYLQKKNWQKLKMPLFVLTLALLFLWTWVILIGLTLKLRPQLCPNSNSHFSLIDICQWNKDTLNHYSLYLKVSLRNLFLPTGFLVASWLVTIFLTQKKKIFYSSLMLLTLASSFYFSQKFLYFSERQFVFPQLPIISKFKQLAGLNRVWSYSNAYVDKNLLSFFGFYSVEGYDALFPSRYSELLNTIHLNGQSSRQAPRSDASLKEMSEIDSFSENPARLRLMSLLGVRFILETKKGEGKELSTSQKRFPANLFNLTWEDDLWRIWEYRHSLPRAFLVKNYLVDNDNQKIIDFLLDPVNDLTKTIVLEKSPRELNSIGSIDTSIKPDKQNSVEIISYEPDRVQINVIALQPGLVFLSDNYFPGWRATVDDKETPIYRADYSFRAVPVVEGEHEIIMWYDPATSRWGKALSFGGIILLLAIFFKSVMMKKRGYGKNSAHDR